MELKVKQEDSFIWKNL